jgi:hypothetical protein
MTKNCILRRKYDVGGLDSNFHVKYINLINWILLFRILSVSSDPNSKETITFSQIFCIQLTLFDLELQIQQYIRSLTFTYQYIQQIFAVYTITNFSTVHSWKNSLKSRLVLYLG